MPVLPSALSTAIAHSTRLVRAAANLSTPCCCALCGQRANDLLCAACEQQFIVIQTRCPVCAMPLPATHLALACGACLRVRPAFDATVVVTDYVAPLDQLVLALKFAGKLPLASLFARLLHDAQQRQALQATLLTCVPLSPQRLATRGFNQTLEIAKPLARLSGLDLHPQLLLRLRDTAAQTGLTPQQRRRNLAGAFSVAPRYRQQLSGQHIAVVDDVITTGQTLHEIALTLKRCGAQRVTNLVFARTLR